MRGPLEDDHLDETVFGPPAHAGTPHGHTHPPGQGPSPGSVHYHAHYHPGGPEFPGDGGTHIHRHEHPLPPMPGRAS